MRRPVNEPGPDIKVIFVISDHILPCLSREDLMKARSCSARSWPDSQVYSVSPRRKMVVGVEVSRYNGKSGCFESLLMI